MSAQVPNIGTTINRDAAIQEYNNGEMRVQTVRGFVFFHVSKDITMAEIPQAFGELIPLLEAALAEGRICKDGPMVARYLETPDNGDRFRLEVGYPVRPGTQPAGGAGVSHVEPYRCASLIYCGSLVNLPKGYDALEADIKRAGLRVTWESREVYYYFEDGASSNNVMHLQHHIE